MEFYFQIANYFFPEDQEAEKSYKTPSKKCIRTELVIQELKHEIAKKKGMSNISWPSTNEKYENSERVLDFNEINLIK